MLCLGTHVNQGRINVREMNKAEKELIVKLHTVFMNWKKRNHAGTLRLANLETMA